MQDLSGKLVVLIGKLETPRADLEARLSAAGAILGKDVTRKTGLVVHGADAATKMLKARGMGVPLVSEKELLEALSGVPAPTQGASVPAVNSPPAGQASPATAPPAAVGQGTGGAIVRAIPRPTAVEPHRLADRLLVRVGEIARRSDVIVHRLAVGGRGNDLSSWEPALPADMLAFYARVNGLVFHYSFADDPEGVQHGFRLVELVADGRSARDRATLHPSWTRAKAGEYDAHVLRRDAGSPARGETPPDPETMALFFEGSSDTAGHFMFGDASSATFGRWTNDGWARPLPGATFTALVEDLIDAGLSWDPPGHRDRLARVERLARPSPERAPLALHVRTRVDLDERAAREHLLAPCTKPQLATLASALGHKAKGEREVILAAIHDGCAALSSADESRQAAVRAALAPLYWIRGRASTASLSYVLLAGTGPIASVELEIEPRLSVLRPSYLAIDDVLVLLDGPRLREWVVEPLLLCGAPYGVGADVMAFGYGEVRGKHHPTKKTLLIPASEAGALTTGTTIEGFCFGSC